MHSLTMSLVFYFTVDDNFQSLNISEKYSYHIEVLEELQKRSILEKLSLEIGRRVIYILENISILRGASLKYKSVHMVWSEYHNCTIGCRISGIDITEKSVINIGVPCGFNIYERYQDGFITNIKMDGVNFCISRVYCDERA